jgi:hypothetical protein
MWVLILIRKQTAWKGSWVQAQALDIPKDGTVVWLREFGQVKIFRTSLKRPDTPLCYLLAGSRVK